MCKCQRYFMFACLLAKRDFFFLFLFFSQAHTLAALKAWCYWLAKLHTASLKNQAYEVQCRELTSKVTLAAVTIIKDECDEEVGKIASRDPSHPQSPSTVLVHSAVHFLVTLTGTVRPPSIWKLKEFTDLYARTQRLRMAPEDHRLLVRSLTNVLLLHWPGLNEQRWEERQKHLAKFLRDISKEFRDIRTTQGFDHNQELQKMAQPAITHTLRIVRDLVENVLDEITQTKKLIYECVREYIDVALWLFPRYVTSPAMCGELFDFFYTAFDVLKAQMGAAAVEAAIQTFMSFFDKELIAKAIADDAVGVRVVERFLGILEFVTKEPNSSFRKFIPSTLQLVLQHIYPLVAEVC